MASWRVSPDGDIHFGHSQTRTNAKVDFVLLAMSAPAPSSVPPCAGPWPGRCAADLRHHRRTAQRCARRPRARPPLHARSRRCPKGIPRPHLRAPLDFLCAPPNLRTCIPGTPLILPPEAVPQLGKPATDTCLTVDKVHVLNRFLELPAIDAGDMAPRLREEILKQHAPPPRTLRLMVSAMLVIVGATAVVRVAVSASLDAPPPER